MAKFVKNSEVGETPIEFLHVSRITDGDTISNFTIALVTLIVVAAIGFLFSNRAR
ncbi:MAG: hypothetical protein AAGH74_09425 [Pseudomonadota bacterium]